MTGKKLIDVLAAILLFIGGLNWGLVGIFNLNLVEYVFGGIYIDRVVYVLVACGSLWQLFNIKGIQSRWSRK